MGSIPCDSSSLTALAASYGDAQADRTRASARARRRQTPDSERPTSPPISRNVSPRPYDSTRTRRSSGVRSRNAFATSGQRSSRRPGAGRSSATSPIRSSETSTYGGLAVDGVPPSSLARCASRNARRALRVSGSRSRSASRICPRTRRAAYAPNEAPRSPRYRRAACTRPTRPQAMRSSRSAPRQRGSMDREATARAN